jgi:hypothetical protein
MERYKSDRSDFQGDGSTESSRQSSRSGDAFRKQLLGLGTDRNTSARPTDQQFSISKKEALESDPIERSFQTHFFSKIEEQVFSQLDYKCRMLCYPLFGREEQLLSLSEQAQFASIERKTPISEVPEKWLKAFLVARGYTALEKVNSFPNEDINTQEVFNSRYKSEIKETEYEDGKLELEIITAPKSERFFYTNYSYKNFVDIEKGVITAIDNFKNRDAKHDGEPLPNSEIFYNQLLAVLRDQQIDPSKFNLTRVIREMITNPDTCGTLDCCIRNRKNMQFTRGSIYRFTKDSDEYYALLGTPNVYGTLYLLRQHPSLFGKKEITGIEVEAHRYLNLILHIGERE